MFVACRLECSLPLEHVVACGVEVGHIGRLVGRNGRCYRCSWSGCRGATTEVTDSASAVYDVTDSASAVYQFEFNLCKLLYPTYLQPTLLLYRIGHSIGSAFELLSYYPEPLLRMVTSERDRSWSVILLGTN